MRGLTLVLAVASTAALLAGLAGNADASASAMPRLYKKCANFNAKYRHGVGRANAHDKVTGDTEPVTNFKRSTAIYKKAMSYNKGLDRDKDGIACEKL